ncbi:hypothetical protein E2P81_ATG01225 [Venturia nashicola]|uniref:Uncharacterized protein n=1 Tax=Venturia nashicola TaxID=86259 RepID=A0A4Z1PLK1_9PEZI|nr:hypothetical protein E6O75_ATG01254 [Venturia nashicola]TLD38682.1 hypothetical protein E2P81_ATG01225 [Venturia nashicola]
MPNILTIDKAFQNPIQGRKDESPEMRAALALLFGATAYAIPLRHQLLDSTRQLATRAIFGEFDANRALSHEARKYDQPEDIGESLKTRQLIIPEIYCKVQPGRPECTELAASQSHQDGGLEAEPTSSRRPEKRIDLFGAFVRTCLEHPDSRACIAWDS